MADNKGIIIYLLCFWTLLTLFTNLFSDYLDNKSLVASNIECLKYNSAADCPQVNSQSDNIVKSTFNNILGNIFNVAEEIPILDLFVPMGRILFFQYPEEVVPPILTVVLDLMAILSLLAFISLVRNG